MFKRDIEEEIVKLRLFIFLLCTTFFASTEENYFFDMKDLDSIIDFTNFNQSTCSQDLLEIDNIYWNQYSFPDGFEVYSSFVQISGKWFFLSSRFFNDKIVSYDLSPKKNENDFDVYWEIFENLLQKLKSKIGRDADNKIIQHDGNTSIVIGDIVGQKKDYKEFFDKDSSIKIVNRWIYPNFIVFITFYIDNGEYVIYLKMEESLE